MDTLVCVFSCIIASFGNLLPPACAPIQKIATLGIAVPLVPNAGDRLQIVRVHLVGGSVVARASFDWRFPFEVQPCSEAHFFVNTNDPGSSTRPSVQHTHTAIMQNAGMLKFSHRAFSESSLASQSKLDPPHSGPVLTMLGTFIEAFHINWNLFCESISALLCLPAAQQVGGTAPRAGPALTSPAMARPPSRSNVL